MQSNDAFELLVFVLDSFYFGRILCLYDHLEDRRDGYRHVMDVSVFLVPPTSVVDPFDSNGACFNVCVYTSSVRA